MSAMIRELYPNAGVERPLKGAYLAHNLHELGTPECPFVYANFVSSIDGRIAVVETGTGESYVLEDLASGNDWRLFQELQAQASCLVTHGGYLRAIAAGKFQDVLQVGVTEQAADIGEWRRAYGLVSQPAVAIASSSLDFALPPSLAAHGQAVYIVTGHGASQERVRAWERQGYPVLFAGSGATVEGGLLVKALGPLGYARIYLLAGPKMLDSVLRDGVLSRLYLTITHQVVGGEEFHTLISGPVLGDSGKLRLRTLYYDQDAPRGTGQWFASFDVRVADQS